MVQFECVLFFRLVLVWVSGASKMFGEALPYQSSACGGFIMTCARVFVGAAEAGLDFHAGPCESSAFTTGKSIYTGTSLRQVYESC
jgi:hypothetical protein